MTNITMKNIAMRNMIKMKTETYPPWDPMTPTVLMTLALTHWIPMAQPVITPILEQRCTDGHLMSTLDTDTLYPPATLRPQPWTPLPHKIPYPNLNRDVQTTSRRTDVRIRLRVNMISVFLASWNWTKCYCKQKSCSMLTAINPSPMHFSWFDLPVLLICPNQYSCTYFILVYYTNRFIYEKSIFLLYTYIGNEKQIMYIINKSAQTSEKSLHNKLNKNFKFRIIYSEYSWTKMDDADFCTSMGISRRSGGGGGFSFLGVANPWVRLCLVKWSLRINRFPHWSQGNFFSPETHLFMSRTIPDHIIARQRKLSYCKSLKCYCDFNVSGTTY